VIIRGRAVKPFVFDLGPGEIIVGIERSLRRAR